ncbi:hypothetical protein [Hydrogenophaga sp. BPS33]|uniref:hypothetical protein n=1 Tax=Hydrogenophaga sp. BPS33 TaxID=2651974 RepID=UPI0013200015|nr:hypothetical protein [Hydrogenophaga sp. BPS33]QHE85497.1 hypothetical protein F9K07_11595 [Hydrogenophaga sp. BPS33]
MKRVAADSDLRVLPQTPTHTQPRQRRREAGAEQGRRIEVQPALPAVVTATATVVPKLQTMTPTVEAPPGPHKGTPLEDHPVIRLETGKWYCFVSGNQLYELQWSKTPELWRDGARAVDIESTNGAVQLLGALVYGRIKSPNKHQSRRSYAQQVLQFNDQPYKNLDSAFSVLQSAFVRSAFSMRGAMGTAFRLQVEGPLPQRLSLLPDASSEPPSLEQASAQEAVTSDLPVPAYDVSRYFAAAIPLTGVLQEHPGGPQNNAPRAEQPPEAWEAFLNPEPWRRARATPGVTGTGTADPRDSVGAAGFGLWDAIQQEDEAAVLRHLLRPGACSEQILQLARQMAASDPSEARDRIVAAVEQAAMLNTHTG